MESLNVTYVTFKRAATDSSRVFWVKTVDKESDSEYEIFTAVGPVVCSAYVEKDDAKDFETTLKLDDNETSAESDAIALSFAAALV